MSAAGRRLARDQDGAAAVLAAGVAAVIMALVAVVVDLGGINAAQRQLQGAVDVAALAAARTPEQAEAAVVRAVEEHGYARTIVAEVTSGSYVFAPEVAADARFVPGGTGAVEAFRVSARAEAPLHFFRLLGAGESLRIGATATAVHAREASFTAGSGLAAIDGGVVNALLGGLLGANLSLSVMDYRSLIAADVELLRMLDVLAVRLRLGEPTYADVLAQRIRFGDLLDAALDAVDDTAARAALLRLRQQTGLGDALSLDRLLDVGLWAPQPTGAGQRPAAGHAAIAVFDLLMAAAQAGAGGRFVDLRLPVVVAGLASLDLRLAVGEPAQARIGIGPEGTRVHTAQTRLLLDLRLLQIDLGLVRFGVRVPVYLEAAVGDARLAAVACASDPLTDGRAAVEARGGVASLAIADVAPGAMRDFSAPPAFPPATLVEAVLLRVTGRARASAAAPAPRLLTFTQADIRAGLVKRAPAERLLSGLLADLGNDLTLDVRVLGLLPLPVGTVVGAILPAVASVLQAVDPVIDAVLRTLGVQLGYVDVSVRGMRCGVPALVQ